MRPDRFWQTQTDSATYSADADFGFLSSVGIALMACRSENTGHAPLMGAQPTSTATADDLGLRLILLHLSRVGLANDQLNARCRVSE
jgi:hypothetical protein